jgi:hypothetical protein
LAVPSVLFFVLCSFVLQLTNFFIEDLHYGAYSYLHLGMGVEWFKEQISNLIEQYELRECLWNVVPNIIKIKRERCMARNFFPHEN